MKRQVITGILIFTIASMLAYIIWGSLNKNVTNPPQSLTDESIEQLTFFYGSTCPHCQDVEKWMNENKLEEKISIDKKEVYENQTNSIALTKAAQSCGLPTDSIGVPFLYTKDKLCLVGTPEITTYLARLIAELPQSSQASASSEGKEK